MSSILNLGCVPRRAWGCGERGNSAFVRQPALLVARFPQLGGWSGWLAFQTICGIFTDADPLLLIDLGKRESRSPCVGQMPRVRTASARAEVRTASDRHRDRACGTGRALRFPLPPGFLVRNQTASLGSPERGVSPASWQAALVSMRREDALRLNVCLSASVHWQPCSPLEQKRRSRLRLGGWKSFARYATTMVSRK
jgi:hypothetical protein